MKFKLSGGADIELFTRDEFREEFRAGLADWLTEIKRGVRFVRHSLYGDTDGSGALLLGAGPGPQVGPAGSMVWAVTRVTVVGLASNETVDLYVNDPGSTSKLATIADVPGYAVFGATGLVLNPLDRLLITGAGLTASAQIIANVQAVELPVQLAWQLLG